ncbi:MAG: nucleoside deaminase [Ignavibacteria bacterium]|nr:nucleoside deaminase [Ignavibacteria bacterium]
MSEEFHRKMMEEAIRLSLENIKNSGGPFGAVITKNGEIVATGVNRVTSKNDPTAHAEIEAIREACKRLQTFDLSDCEIYSSCEPCPMCLSAIYWSRLSKIFYGGTRHDAGNAGFRDDFLYDEIAAEIEKRKIPSINLMNKEAIEAFEKWMENPEKTDY